MSSWNQLAEYVRRNYRIKDENNGIMSLHFDVPGGRSQLVLLYSASLMDGDEEWLIIESAIGHIDEVNLRAALTQVGDMVCGGLAVVGETYVGLRHAVPLENLDVNEFERPLALVTTSADRLEGLLLGQDRM